MPKFLFSVLIGMLLFSCHSRNNADEDPYPISVHPDSLVKANRAWVKQSVDNNRAYAKNKEWNFVEMENGVIYEVLKNNNGDKIVSGDLVEWSYTVDFLNGTLCYSSKESGNRISRLDYDEIEAGMSVVMKKLGLGDSARLVLPPHMAYGLSGDGNKVPPRSSLVYHISIVKKERRD